MENYFGINMGIIQEHEYKIGCIQANDIWGFLVDTYGSRPYKDTQI